MRAWNRTVGLSLAASLLIHLVAGVLIWRLYLSGERGHSNWVEFLPIEPRTQRWSVTSGGGGPRGARLWRGGVGGEDLPSGYETRSAKQGLPAAGPLANTGGMPGTGTGQSGFGTRAGRVFSSGEGLPAPGEELANPELPADTLQSLEAIEMETFHRRVAEREQYKALVLHNADTTDARGRNHSLARKVVMDAIVAMGGQEALVRLKTINYEGRFHEAYGARSQLTQYLPGGAKLVYDGERGWVDVFGTAYPLKGQGLREVQRQTRRWDFLSRYLGDGVQLSYVEARANDPERYPITDGDYHIILVDDREFGGAFLAFFDRETHLLAAEERPPEAPLQRDLFLEYGQEGSAFVYHKVEHLVGLKKKVPRRYSSPVQYNSQAAAGVFAVSGGTLNSEERMAGESADAAARRDALDERLQPASQTAPRQVEATLWVDVQMGNATPASARLLSGASAQPSLTQMVMVREQVSRTVVEELSRRHIFRRIIPLEHLQVSPELHPGEYLLEILLRAVTIEDPLPAAGPETYQARLFGASPLQQIMQDGPPYKRYYLDPRRGGGCYFYMIRPFTIADDIGYLDRNQLVGLVRRMSDKAEQAVRLYRQGERRRFPYMDDCCYCQEPR